MRSLRPCSDSSATPSFPSQPEGTEHLQGRTAPPSSARVGTMLGLIPGRPQHHPVVPSPPPSSPFPELSLHRTRNDKPETAQSVKSAQLALILRFKRLSKRIFFVTWPRSSFCAKRKHNIHWTPRNARFLACHHTKCLWRGLGLKISLCTIK